MRPRSGKIHLRKTFNGTPAHEVWSGSVRPCNAGGLGCGKPAALRILVWEDYKDLRRHHPEILAAYEQRIGRIPTVPMVHPNTRSAFSGVCVSDVTACHEHKREAELAAAKLPSWVVVEISRGPGPDTLVAQVPRNLVELKGHEK